jgi:hypothetical protein
METKYSICISKICGTSTVQMHSVYRRFELCLMANTVGILVTRLKACMLPRHQWNLETVP